MPTLTSWWTVTYGGSIDGSTFTAWSEPGIYELSLVILVGTDESAPAQTTVVIYDPTGGFVTGGGWINSPVGAYRPDPGAIGMANFGFVSKYKKGATRPSGQAAFGFSAGALNFLSDSYEWLVVNQGGTNAQFRGFGTVNDQYAPSGEPYRFMLWASEGEPDTFRMRIWYESGGVEIDVYDNGVKQPIGGGSIVVHTGGKGRR